MDKSVLFYWWFSFDLYYLILGGTNVPHFSVTKIFVQSVKSGEKVLQ